MIRIQEKMTKNYRFARPSEQNRRGPSVVYQFQNLVDTTTRMLATFNFCFRFVALMDFELFFS